MTEEVDLYVKIPPNKEFKLFIYNPEISIPVKKEHLKVYRFQLWKDNNNKMVEHINKNYLEKKVENNGD